MQQFQTGLLLIFVVLTVRQQNVCIMRIVSVMQERSVWKAVMPVIVKAQSVRLSSAANI